jgi:hypothetical protein
MIVCDGNDGGRGRADVDGLRESLIAGVSGGGE